jgi:hypothetical protein
VVFPAPILPATAICLGFFVLAIKYDSWFVSGRK